MSGLSESATAMPAWEPICLERGNASAAFYAKWLHMQHMTATVCMLCEVKPDFPGSASADCRTEASRKEEHKPAGQTLENSRKSSRCQIEENGCHNSASQTECGPAENSAKLSGPLSNEAICACRGNTESNIVAKDGCAGRAKRKWTSGCSPATA